LSELNKPTVQSVLKTVKLALIKECAWLVISLRPILSSQVMVGALVYVLMVSSSKTESALNAQQLARRVLKLEAVARLARVDGLI
jgi:hypothetical protein